MIASRPAVSAHAQSVAQLDMRRAVEAFNSGDFHRALEYFERAVSLDPNYINARLHLATALIREHMASAPNFRVVASTLQNWPSQIPGHDGVRTALYFPV